MEADWPDARQIDRFVRGTDMGATNEQAFARFPSWMWRNTDMGDFNQLLQRHYQPRADEDKVEFRGLDIYSPRSSISEVLAYLGRTAPAASGTNQRKPDA